MTDTWRDYVTDRLRAFKSNKDRNIKVHGADAVAALERFYDAVFT